MAKKNNETMKQASKDIREWCRQEHKSYINISKRELDLFRINTSELGVCF